MSELAERARGLAEKIDDMLANQSLPPSIGEMAVKFEQALLAERRLAMEEAAKIADEHQAEFIRLSAMDMGTRVGYQHRSIAAQGLAVELRAAAEREVGTK